MHLFVMRHGERDPLRDDQLSRGGHDQAQKLAEWMARGELPQPASLVCSPKLRTQQTLNPVSQSLGIALTRRDELDERKAKEPPSAWSERVDQFIGTLESFQSPVVLCSHFDWILEFMTRLPSDITEVHPFAPGEWLQLEKVENIYLHRASGTL